MKNIIDKLQEIKRISAREYTKEDLGSNPYKYLCHELDTIYFITRDIIETLIGEEPKRHEIQENFAKRTARESERDF